jgi:CheY-like chemotaxis protein
MPLYGVSTPFSNPPNVKGLKAVFMVDCGVLLLAEDREDDILLLRKAFAKANLLNPVHLVRDGAEVIAYLTGEGKYANRIEFPLPDLLLLDLQMPKMNGFEVLTWIRQQPNLRALRVVVLTSSDRIQDVNLAYQLGANSFVVKPMDFDQFVEVSRAVKGYWLWLSKAPEILRTPTWHPLEDSSPTDLSQGTVGK